MAPNTEDQAQLPGLEVPEPKASDSPMVLAAKASLDQLKADQVIGPRHAVQVQLVLQLAGAIDAGTRSGRASAVAMASKELRETMLVLDPPDENIDPGAKGRLDAFLAGIEAAAKLAEDREASR